MQPGQARVIGLILILLALEVVLHPAIKAWLSGLISGWNTALSNAANPTPAQGFTTPFGAVPPTSQPTGKNTQPGTISRVGTQCPPGQTFVPLGGGTTGICR